MFENNSRVILAQRIEGISEPMSRPAWLDNLVECPHNVENEMVTSPSAIYSFVGYNICGLLCHIDAGRAHTTLCIIVYRHVIIHINLNIVINKLHYSVVMVLEEHRHSYLYVNTINIPMRIVHKQILYQLSHNVLNNYLCHFDKNSIEKISNMDSEISAIHSTYITVYRCYEKPCYNLYHNDCCCWVLVAG